MTTAAVITGCLDGIVLALTPVQRWGAARQFNNSFIARRELILIAVASIVILAVLLMVISFNRIRRERKTTEKLFTEYAVKRGLTARERQILLSIANEAGLKRNESIFTLISAFDSGAAKVEKNLAGRQTDKESRQLEAVLFSLREKLGFKKEPSYSRSTPAESEKLSSRQIPVGRKVDVVHRKAQDSEAIEATVVKNSDTELAVRLTKPVTITFGEYWNVHYYFGTSIWEFDTSVISYDGNVMVLSHSDNIRFINRRRFLRVPVQKPAFIAQFPFERKLRYSIDDGIKNGETTQDSADILLRPPEFIPAVVTELGGPGLRIEAAIEVKTGDRVLVMFELDRGKEQDSAENPGSSGDAALKVIEDIGVVEEIGEVKGVRNIKGSISLGVELTDLSDSNIDELICVTNAASLNVSDRNENTPVEEDAPQHVPQHNSVQGV